MMRLRYFTIIGIIVGTMLSGCASLPLSMDSKKYLQFSFQGDQGEEIFLKTQIADTPEERDRGLMYVEAMPEREGMVFLFEKSQILSFWMKNTLIPLDIIFLDEHWRIVNIVRSAEPCKVDPCPLYSSAGPARYVLEINGGLADKFGLSEGNVLRPASPSDHEVSS